MTGKPPLGPRGLVKIRQKKENSHNKELGNWY